MDKMSLQVHESPVGMMCAKKYANDIGKSHYWILQRIKDGSFPVIDCEAENQEYVIDILELNARLRAKAFVITSPRKNTKQSKELKKTL